MSYINYPRLHFTGKFKASPSTINNAPNNYDPLIYPTPDDLDGVELYWNPKGDGGFELIDCVVSRIDYSETSSATTPEEDSIIGQPVSAVRTNFPLPAAMVDLDPYQQNVSEIWAMSIQIGGEAASVMGAFSPISFYSIWQQCQGNNAPHSSASGSGVYQSKLTGLQYSGDTSGSPFLEALSSASAQNLSVNFNVTQHNNLPPIYAFNTTTFAAMQEGEDPVPAEVIAKLQPMTGWFQNYEPQATPTSPLVKGDPGNIPTEAMVVYMLKQLLPTRVYNANVNKIIECSKVPYSRTVGTAPNQQIFPDSKFTQGVLSGTVGEASSSDPDHFVASRMLCPPQGATTPLIYFTPFVVSADGHTITLNLGNSLSTVSPSFAPSADVLGTLSLVALDGTSFTVISEIPYQDAGFMTTGAGFFTCTDAETDYSEVQLGIVSEVGGDSTVIVAENPNGYYMRADQFVFRMNPGEVTGVTNPRGSTAISNIHLLQWGKPAPAGIEIEVSQMISSAAELYTKATLGTGGTKGIVGISEPQNILTINGTTLPSDSEEQLKVTVETNADGIAQVDLSCIAPGNPRGFVDGQIYFLEYGFAESSLQSSFIQDSNDKISILVYDEVSDLDGDQILAKWGRLYKIMGFLTDEEKVTEISFRNVIKQMLEKPFSDVKHMPLTRDLGKSARSTVIDWIDSLNNSTPS